jgi:putative protein kinase ArgK-like GTPase of G3E family
MGTKLDTKTSVSAILKTMIMAIEYGTTLSYKVTIQQLIDYLQLDGQSLAAGITAFAGGGQSSATALNKANNRIDTCATSGDSCKTLAAIVGRRQKIHNNTSNNVYLYPESTENFLGLADDAYIIIYPGQVVDCICYSIGEWTYYI